MNLTPNRTKYYEIVDKLSFEDRKKFDDYLLGALFVVCDKTDFSAALKTASNCLATVAAARNDKAVQS